MGLFRRSIKSTNDHTGGAITEREESGDAIDYSNPHDSSSPTGSPIVRNDTHRKYNSTPPHHHERNKNMSVVGTPDTAPLQNEDDEEMVEYNNNGNTVRRKRSPHLTDMHITVQQERKQPKQPHYVVNNYEESEEEEVDQSTISDLSASLYRPPSSRYDRNIANSPTNTNNPAEKGTNNNNEIVEPKESSLVSSVLSSALLGACTHPSDMLTSLPQGIFPTPHQISPADPITNIPRDQNDHCSNLKKQQVKEGEYVRPPVWGIAPSESESDSEGEEEEGEVTSEEVSQESRRKQDRGFSSSTLEEEAVNAAGKSLLDKADRSGEFESIELVLEPPVSPPKPQPVPTRQQPQQQPETHARSGSKAQNYGTAFGPQGYTPDPFSSIPRNSMTTPDNSPTKKVTISPNTSTHIRTHSGSSIPLCQPVSSPTSYPPPRGVYNPNSSSTKKQPSLMGKKDQSLSAIARGVSTTKSEDDEKKDKGGKRKGLKKGLSSLFRKSKKNVAENENKSRELPELPYAEGDAENDGAAGGNTNEKRTVVGILKKPRHSRLSFAKKDDGTEEDDDGDNNQGSRRVLSFAKDKSNEKSEAESDNEGKTDDDDDDSTEDSYPWRQVKDVGTGRYYYYHIDTKATTWKKPEDWDEYMEDTTVDGGEGSVSEVNQEDVMREQRERSAVAIATAAAAATAAASAGVASHKSRELDVEKDKNVILAMATPSENVATTTPVPTSQPNKSTKATTSDSKAKKQAIKLLSKISPDKGSNAKLVYLFKGREDQLVDKLENIIEETPFDEQGDMSGVVRQMVNNERNNGGVVGQERALPRKELHNNNDGLEEDDYLDSLNAPTPIVTTSALNSRLPSGLTYATSNTHRAPSTAGSTYSANGFNSRVRSEATYTTGLTGLISNGTDATKQASNTTRGVFLNNSNHSSNSRRGGGRSMATTLDSTAESSMDTDEVGLILEDVGEEGEDSRKYVLDFDNDGPNGDLPGSRHRTRNGKAGTSHRERGTAASSNGAAAAGRGLDHNGNNRRMQQGNLATNDNDRTSMALKKNQQMKLKGAIERRDWEKAASMADDLSKDTESLRSRSTFEAAENDIYQKNIIKNDGNKWTQTDLDKFISQNDWGAVSNYIAKMRQTQEETPQQPKDTTIPQQQKKQQKRQSSVTNSVLQCLSPTLLNEDQYQQPPQQQTAAKDVPRKRFGARSQLQHDHIDDNWAGENEDDDDSSNGEGEDTAVSSISSYSRRRGRRGRRGSERKLPEKMEHRTMQV